MIKSKQDYIRYIEADRVALNYPKFSLKLAFKLIIKRDKILVFQRLLRKLEYLKNVKVQKSLYYRLLYFIYKIRFKNLSLKLGLSIPENVFGPGLAIIHYGTIIVNPRAKVGANCRLHACTNIGESGGVAGAPQIGDNVYIGPGVKIYGNIKVGNNIAFAANAAVGKDCLADNSLYGGIPAKRIKELDITRIIKHLNSAN